MDAPSGPPDAERARIDELRRRLYRPDATEADRARYLAARRTVPEEAVREPDPPVRTRRRPPRAGLLAVVPILAAVAVVLPLQRSFVGSTTATPDPTWTAPRGEDIGEGRVLALTGGAVSRPVPVAVSVRGADVVGRRYTGHGNAVVTFDPPEGSLHGGRAMILLTSNGSSRTGWRALLRVDPLDRRPYTVVLARGSADTGSGTTTPTTFVYPGEPPRRIAVLAVGGADWTLEVAVTNGLRAARG